MRIVIERPATRSFAFTDLYVTDLFRSVDADPRWVCMKISPISYIALNPPPPTSQKLYDYNASSNEIDRVYRLDATLTIHGIDGQNTENPA